MPIENEKKFVLSNFSSLEEQIKEEAIKVYHIEQAYLCKKKKLSVRIRKYTLGEKSYKMTVKQQVNGHCVEIETEISERDYNLLEKVARIRLNKIRYELSGGWEVDFFKNGKETYFVMAEIEMPEGQEDPDEIHPLVENNLLFKVEKIDNRFSSRKIASISYTKKVLDKLMLTRI